MSSRFAGQTAFVVGGNSGIGAAVVQRLHKEGANVVIACRRTEVGDELAATLAGSGAALVVPCDVTSEASVRESVARTVAAFGPPTVLVHAAGMGGALSAVGECSDEYWQHIMDVNLNGAFRVARAVLHEMVPARRGGSLVFVGSISSLQGVPRAAPYVASKTGLIGLTRSLAWDYAAHGIRANCVCPAFIETPLLDDALAAQPDPMKTRMQWRSFHALGRFGTPDEVAAAVSFLSSSDAAFITGVTLPVDGGMTVGRIPGAPPES